MSSNNCAEVFSGFLNLSRILRIAATARPGSRAIVSAMNASAVRASRLRGVNISAGKSFRFSVTSIAAWVLQGRCEDVSVIFVWQFCADA